MYERHGNELLAACATLPNLLSHATMMRSRERIDGAHDGRWQDRYRAAGGERAWTDSRS